MSIGETFFGLLRSSHAGHPQVAPRTTTPSPDRGPYWATHEWQVTLPEKQNMGSTALGRITSYLQDSGLELAQK